MGRIARLSAIFAVLCAGSALAGDLKGSKDLPFLKRFSGSEIVNYETQAYDTLSIASPDPQNPDSWVFAPVEGQITQPAVNDALVTLRRDTPSEQAEVPLPARLERRQVALQQPDELLVQLV